MAAHGSKPNTDPDPCSRCHPPKRNGAETTLASIRDALHDCVIKVSSARTVGSIPAHRAVLARATYFDALFKREDPEWIERRDPITNDVVMRGVYILRNMDVDPDALAFLCRCLYDPTLINTPNVSGNLPQIIDAMIQLGAPDHFAPTLITTAVYVLASYFDRQPYLYPMDLDAQCSGAYVRAFSEAYDPRRAEPSGISLDIDSGNSSSSNSARESEKGVLTYTLSKYGNERLRVKTPRERADQLDRARLCMAHFVRGLVCNAKHLDTDTKVRIISWIAGVFDTDIRHNLFRAYMAAIAGRPGATTTAGDPAPPPYYKRRSFVGAQHVDAQGRRWQSIRLAFDRLGLSESGAVASITWQGITYRGYMQVSDETKYSKESRLYVCVTCAPKGEVLCVNRCTKERKHVDDASGGTDETVPVRPVVMIAHIYHPLCVPITERMSLRTGNHILDDESDDGGASSDGEAQYRKRTGLAVPDQSILVPTPIDRSSAEYRSPIDGSEFEMRRVPIEYEIKAWGGEETRSRVLVACEVEIRVETIPDDQCVLPMRKQHDQIQERARTHAPSLSSSSSSFSSSSLSFSSSSSSLPTGSLSSTKTSVAAAVIGSGQGTVDAHGPIDAGYRLVHAARGGLYAEHTTADSDESDGDRDTEWAYPPYPSAVTIPLRFVSQTPVEWSGGSGDEEDDETLVSATDLDDDRGEYDQEYDDYGYDHTPQSEGSSYGGPF